MRIPAAKASRCVRPPLDGQLRESLHVFAVTKGQGHKFDTIHLYEEGRSSQLRIPSGTRGGCHGPAGCRADRAVLISLWPSRCGRTRSGWRLLRRSNSIRGSSGDQVDRGTCRGEWFVLGEDVPDRLGELAGEIDPGDLGAALTPEALLRALVALPIVGVAGGMGRRFDQRPAQVLRAVLGQRAADVAIARLADERAEPGISGELLGAGETADVTDP